MEQDFSLRFLAAVLGQWWKVLVPITLLLMCASAAVVIYTFQPKYHASAWLQVKEQQPFVVFPEDDPAVRDATKKFVHTQIELIRSPLVLAQVLSQPKVAEMPELRSKRDPITWLATKGLQISLKGDSELLEVAFEGTNPDRSASLVNAIIDAYFNLRKEKRGEHTQRVIDLLDLERSRRAAEIARLQSDIREMRRHLVANDPTLVVSTMSDSDVVVSDHPLKNIQNNLARAQVEEKTLEAQVQALEESLSKSTYIHEALVERGVEGTPEFQEAMQAIRQKQMVLGRVMATSRLGENDPAYRRIQREIGEMQKNLEEVRAEARPRVREEMEALANIERHQQLEQLRTDLDTQRRVVQSMLSDYHEKVKDAGQSGGETLDLRFRQDELDREQQVFDMISQRATQLKTELGAPSRVEPIQLATPPDVPVELLPWKLLAVALLGSLILPFGLAVLWENSVRRVTNVDQLQENGSLPVVGEIAQLPTRLSPQATTASRRSRYELGLFEESVDSLRTGLMLSHDNNMQVLAVVSATSGEGKSSVAAQLAVSLARAARRPTLLIDGDMRSPDVHRIFHIERTPGLACVLEGKCSLAEAINRQWSEEIHLLPAGELLKSPHKLVGSGEFQRLIEAARLEYDYVVIDTPPVLAASESLVMAKEADGTLICAMRDYSRESLVRLTCQRLHSVGARTVGTVLNGVPTRQYTRRYGSYGY